MHTKREQALVARISEVVSGLSTEEKKRLFQQVLEEETVPVSIFSSTLSGLGALVVYLKDVEKKSVKEIGQILNRKVPTIYTTYSKAKGKRVTTTSTIHIPLNIFKDRKFSILEHLVVYLKQTYSLIEISRLLNKHPSTIKTTYWRLKKK